MKKDYEEYKKENIEITFKGKKYALIEAAEMYTYQRNGWDITEYNAAAVDRAGDLYSVTWKITDEFANQLQEAGIMEAVDEQYACDWENPIAVEKV